MSDVIEEIRAERRRQIEDEGWVHEHDDWLDRGEIALAAACYAMNAGVASSFVGSGRLTGAEVDAAGASCPMPEWWPFEACWWRPKSRRRNLIRAAAMIVAEIERLDRAAR